MTKISDDIKEILKQHQVNLNGVLNDNCSVQKALKNVIKDLEEQDDESTEVAVQMLRILINLEDDNNSQKSGES